MRLINADKLFDIVVNVASNDKTLSNDMRKEWDCFIGIICLQPTVEAVPVEQVANFLMKFLDDIHPCNFVWFEEKMMDDEWCAYNCPIGENVKTGNECWIHAIREGWLDE